MHCPYCQQSVAEPSRCAVGGLDLARQDGLPGILLVPVPLLQPLSGEEEPAAVW